MSDFKHKIPARVHHAGAQKSNKARTILLNILLYLVLAGIIAATFVVASMY